MSNAEEKPGAGGGHSSGVPALPHVQLDTSLLNPLPHVYLTDTPGIGGCIKRRPEDFLVDEQPLYEPCGRGEHLYLFIEKRNVSHIELLAALRKRFNVKNTAIGFAGMKDKVGVTRQLVSVHTPETPSNLSLDHDRIHALWADRHTNKLRRGHLLGNRFSIRIREVDPLHAPRAMQTLRTLEKVGVPNYFGDQRFGYRRNNHLLGAMLLAGQFDELLEELLGTEGTPFPEYQRERRELYKQGRYAEALEMWTPADASERSALRSLAQGSDGRRASLSVGKTVTGFWIAAMQSAVFNHVLDRRIQEGLFDRLIAGDLAWKHNSRAVFHIDAELARDEDIHRRFAQLEISPSGPLWGVKMTSAAGHPGEAEACALREMGFEPESLPALKGMPDGGRRSLREPIRDTQLEAGIDEHGPFIRVAFDLPRGVYATIALREIMKNAAHDERTEWTE